METDNKKLMSISEVAKYLGISRYGVIQLIKTNVVKANQQIRSHTINQNKCR